VKAGRVADPEPDRSGFKYYCTYNETIILQNYQKFSFQIFYHEKYTNLLQFNIKKNLQIGYRYGTIFNIVLVKCSILILRIRVQNLLEMLDPDPYKGNKSSVADPGSGAFLTPASGIPGSGIRNRFFPDHGSRILDLKTIFLRAF
jgi:hypothetical protein